MRKQHIIKRINSIYSQYRNTLTLNFSLRWKLNYYLLQGIGRSTRWYSPCLLSPSIQFMPIRYLLPHQ